MRRLVVIAVAFLSLLAKADLAKFGALVLDEATGVPMLDVRVSGMFFWDTPMWNRVKGGHGPAIVEKRTDASGRVSFSGHTNCGVVGARMEGVVEGYYIPENYDSVKLRGRGQSGDWLPDNLVMTIALQRVERPIPLRARVLTGDKGGVFGQEDVLKYDFLFEDWLPPKGTGVVADIVFTRLPVVKCLMPNSAGKLEDGAKYQMKVEFPGEGNGVREMHPPRSAGILIRGAPESGYEQALVRQEMGVWHEPTRNDFDIDRCYCFRIRTRRNAEGELVDGYYGKIYRDIQFDSESGKARGVGSVRMEYYFNPTPLDRNLEFNCHSLSQDPRRRWWTQY